MAKREGRVFVLFWLVSSSLLLLFSDLFTPADKLLKHHYQPCSHSTLPITLSRLLLPTDPSSSDMAAGKHGGKHIKIYDKDAPKRVTKAEKGEHALMTDQR